jgi:hypothetical protein
LAVVGYPSTVKNTALTVGVWFLFLAVVVLAVSIVAGAFILAQPATLPVVTPQLDSHVAIVTRIESLDARVLALEARVGRLGSRVGSDVGAK